MKKNILIILMFFIVTSFISKSKKPMKFMPQPKGFVYIPSGTCNNLSFKGFWMSETEVTNQQYSLFLKDLLDSGKNDLFKLAYPDTLMMKSKQWIGVYNINYFTNPYFKNHPVVCVTPFQVNLYSKWLTQKCRSQYPEQEFPEFRLPDLFEWQYAALAFKCYNNQYFTWNGEYINNSLGCPLANFFQIDQKFILGFNDSPYLSNNQVIKYYKDYYLMHSNELEKTNNLKTLFYTKKRKYILKALPMWADSYFPNDYGVYNLCGNVAEMVMYDSLKVGCVGGSYQTTGAYLRLDWLLDHHQKDSLPQIDVGFRLIIDYKKPKN